METILIAIILWYAFGCFSFCYWWTSDFDLTNKEYGLIFTAGFFGPISWIGGYIIHSKSKNKEVKILFKSRKKQ